MMATTAARPSLAAQAAAIALSGALAGFVVAGPGGRLAMRLSAQIDRSAHGLLTEAGARVGEFTLAGTVGLVVFVGLAGALLAGIVWSLVSPWLPADRRLRRAAAFVVGMALGGRFAVDGTNIDFRLLDPALLQAAIFVVLAGLTGLVAAVLEPVVTERFEHPGRLARGASWVVVVAGVALSVPFGLLFFSEESCGCASPPWLVGIALVGLGALWLVRLVWPLRNHADPTWMPVAGRSLVLVVTLAGFAHLVGEIGHFV